MLKAAAESSSPHPLLNESASDLHPPPAPAEDGAIGSNGGASSFSELQPSHHVKGGASEPNGEVAKQHGEGKPVGGIAAAVRESDGRLPSAAAIPCDAGEEELIEDCDDSCQAREFALEHALRDADATKATLEKSLDDKASEISALQFEVRGEAAKAATACEALRVEKLAHEKTADDKAAIEKALDEAYCEKLALAEAARVEIAALQELLEKATCEAATREKQSCH